MKHTDSHETNAAPRDGITASEIPLAQRITQGKVTYETVTHMGHEQTVTLADGREIARIHGGVHGAMLPESLADATLIAEAFDPASTEALRKFHRKQLAKLQESVKPERTARPSPFSRFEKKLQSEIP